MSRRRAAPEMLVNVLGQQINLTESRRVREQIGTANRLCYWNALRALRSSRFRAEPGACYVEGWAVSSLGLAMEHAWIERASGEIVEPTPAWHEGEPARYFPVVRRSRAAMARLRMPSTYFPLRLDERGLLSDAERRAHAETQIVALAHALGRDAAFVEAWLRGGRWTPEQIGLLAAALFSPERKDPAP